VTSVPGQTLHDQSLHNQNVPSQSPPSQSPAGRRPRRPAAERRRQILAAARRLFAERGFDATTTRDLAAAADINDALIYRYFPDKHAILAALVDEAIAVFQGLPKPPDQAAVPLESLLELLGTGFVDTIRANLDLVTILISERQALAGDTRFVEFVDDAATRLGRLIDATAGAQADGHDDGQDGHGDGQGYLTARAYFGALIAFVLLQDQLGLGSIRQVDAAEYVRHLAQVTVRGIT
jgi:AcrR family transcriptional regulator